jgi:Peptidase family M48
MIKSIASFFCLCLMGFSLLFGAAMHDSPAVSPPHSQHVDASFLRAHKMDATSKFAQQRLKRGEAILSTLVSDPQNYQLILSTNSCFGGEAVAPNILSDKPTIILYQGALSPNRSDDEVAFMIAHELGHLALYHNEKMDGQMQKIANGPPAGISGTLFSIFFQKLQERQADMFGLYLYEKAGYDNDFFPHTLHILKINPNIHFGSNKIFSKQPGSLSLKDSHFSMQERFELLVATSQNPASVISQFSTIQV